MDKDMTPEEVLDAVNRAMALETGDATADLTYVGETIVWGSTRWIKVDNGYNTSWVTATDGYAEDIRDIIAG